MNFKNSLLGGLVLAGGAWLVWAVFLLAKTIYENEFFMALGAEVQSGFRSLNYWESLLLGLGIAIIGGLIIGVFYYFIQKIFSKNSRKI